MAARKSKGRAARKTAGLAKGGGSTDPGTLDIVIPPELEKLYGGKPRLLLKRLEWYGIHPLPLDVLGPEIRALTKDYDIIAVPKSMNR